MKKSTITIFVVAGVWLATALCGTWAMMAYSNQPGNAGAASIHWPGASGLPRPVHRPVLVLFFHPHCPCSRASLGELALLMTHCVGKLDVHAVFIDPVEMEEEDWAKTDLWRSAESIPGVVVTRDVGAREAAAFRTATSGDALLYNADGSLIFHGGITLARGHSGDNPGRSAIEAVLHGETVSVATTPVFGCGLFEESQPGQQSWKQ